MSNFYALKRALFLPLIAGVMRSKHDVPYLYDLILHERNESRENMKRAHKACVNQGQIKTAMRLKQDSDMMDKVYAHDIALLAAYMTEEDLRPM